MAAIGDLAVAKDKANAASDPTATHFNKEFPQTLVAKVKAKLNRVARERKELEQQLKATKKDLENTRKALIERQNALLNAADDENELLLRVVEAKLHLEAIGDEKAVLSTEITALRRETVADEATASSIESELLARKCLLDQTIHDTEEYSAAAAALTRKALEWETKAKSAREATDFGTAAIERERARLTQMEGRYDTMRRAVWEVLRPPAAAS